MKQLKIHSAWVILLLALGSCNNEADLGIFEGNNDIGNVGYAGSIEFDSGTPAATSSNCCCKITLKMIRWASSRFSKMVSISGCLLRLSASRSGVECLRIPCFMASTLAQEKTGIIPPFFRSIRPSSSWNRPNSPSGDRLLQAFTDISFKKVVLCEPSS